MAGKRQPTSVVVANGKKHLTKAETDARLDQEVRPPVPQKARPPKWLAKEFHLEFRELGKLLLRSGLYTDLDRDVLGQYLVARERWERADGLVLVAIGGADEKLAGEWGRLQATYFKQCRQCAEAMGLSVTSRCRIVVPQAVMPPAPSGSGGEGEGEFMRLLRERQAAAMAASE